MTVDAGYDIEADGADGQQSLGTAAARNLATTTKSAPQMQGISSRWLLRMLPWVQVAGGTYRVNRRLTYAVGRGRVGFAQTADNVQVVPPTLRELPLLRGFEDEGVLAALAARFTQREFAAGDVLTEAGGPVDQVFLVAHGKINKMGEGKYGDTTVLGVFADGDHFGDEALVDDDARWAYAATAVTSGTLMVLPRAQFQSLVDQSPELLVQIAQFLASAQQSTNKHGEAAIEMSAGHEGEIDLPGTFVDYELSPREYELSVAQTVLRIHSRVADLYNQPMNQIEQQLKLTIEALRERQEHELVNNKEFGLLHNADHEQRIHTHHGPPTPDDMDELLCRRRDTSLFLAHPRTIAAFGRECSRLGLYPATVDLQGSQVPAWRGVPVLPCNKIPITDGHTSSIIAMRLGEHNQGVIGLHQTGLPDEVEPSLSVRFMGINEKAVISYLVSAYYSAAVLVPDAIGVLENVEIARPRD
ncbi:family 2B encapsulin nanocompartment shell protein [Yinghuangia aomiensis]|uniref:Family 2B encapsulin nanocompartment shell protein n=1 Tax=Yinghuangia aomiensis TaxID=676205 RepID=A0ABP9HBV6_9ACTN